LNKSSQAPYEKNVSAFGWFWFIKIFLVLIFSVLVLRLWFLQIAKGSDYLNRAENNHIKQLEMPSTRGLILDRDGKPLVENQAVFDLLVTPKEVTNPEELAIEVGKILGRDSVDLLDRYNKISSVKYYSTNTWLTGLTRADLALIESRRHRLDGLSIEVNSVRRPLRGDFAPHVMGYVSQISQSQLDGGDYPGFRPGELVGQSGLEQSLEKYLQGRRGSRLVTVDSKGRILEELDADYPSPGYNIRLTIDSRLQRVAQALLGEHSGAVVVLDPRNFEILALASSPMYNLNDFIGGISQENWTSLNEDPFTPMQNRAVNGQYPPGSTFKIAVSLAALAEGVITPDTTFNCGGVLRMGNHPFRCWARSGHGSINLFNSLKYSCDIYYYEVGRRLGIDRLAARVREFFGLGRTLGLELSSEQAGLVPDQAWKMRRLGRSWNPGETLPVSIGQGYLLTTPLQVAQYTGVLANGGTLYRPHLVKEVVDFDGKIVHNTVPEVINTVPVNPDYFEIVRRGLQAVVNEPGGTGRRARLPDVLVAGKTGTSQTVSLERFQSYTAANRPYKLRDHAWFTAYAPAEKPEVVVTILLEHTGGGGAKAAPVAAKMMAAYFDKSIDTHLMPPFQVQPDQPTGWEGEL
jgi:penicillin-binding protein 2